MGLTDRFTEGARREVGEAVSGRVLEVGIGTGLSLPHYGPAVTSVVGVDVSRGMLRRAALRIAAPGSPPGALAQMDAQRLAFGAAAFDSVAFNLCLCTIPEPAAAIREALRVVRPGGTLIFLEHVRSHLWPIGLMQDLITPLTLRLEGDHFNRRTLESVRAAGAEVESVRRWALGFFNLIRARAPA